MHERESRLRWPPGSPGDWLLGRAPPGRGDQGICLMREQTCDDCIAERNLHSLFLTVTLYIVSLLSSVYTKGLIG